MDEGAKTTVDILSRELMRVYAKSGLTDDWFFRFLSIAVVPFLAFLAYALVNAQYRIFIAALPFLSIVGSAVVLLLSSHYAFTVTYANYLEKRINELLRGPELRDARFGRAVYGGWSSAVLLSHMVGFSGLIAINLVAVPIINDTIRRYCAVHPNLPYNRAAALATYWMTVILSVTVFLAAAGNCVYGIRRRCSKASAS